MTTRARPRPLFVPDVYQPELARLSKAALMDIIWDMATELAADSDPLAHASIMQAVRAHAIVVVHRHKQHQQRVATREEI